jgi:hypothetical protein
MCCNWWKKCTYAAYTIPTSVYMGLEKLLWAPNLRSISLNVIDNSFDEGKAKILLKLLEESKV